MTTQTSSSPVYRLGIDPGETTGWAVFKDEELDATGIITGGVEAFIEWANSAIYFRSVAEIIIEDFDIDGTITGTWSSEIIGAVRALRRPAHQKLFVQKRAAKTELIGVRGLTGDQAEAKRFAWLKAHGFEDAGGGHNLDAVTHVLVRLKRGRDRAAYRRYWA